MTRRLLTVLVACVAAVVATASAASADYAPPTYTCSTYTAFGLVGWTVGGESAVCFGSASWGGYVVNDTFAGTVHASQADQVCIGEYPTPEDPRQFVVCASLANVVRYHLDEWSTVDLYPGETCLWSPVDSPTVGMLCSQNRVSAYLGIDREMWVDAYLCVVPVPQYTTTGCLPYVFVPLIDASPH